MQFKIVVITSEHFLQNETETIILLFENGLKTLHVRKPKTTKNELRDYLERIPKKYRRKIVIHSHYKLADELHLKGIHLTEKAKKSSVKHQKSSIVSGSFHTIKDILRSRKKYEYVFLSPVFDSLSKKNYNGNFLIKELKQLTQKRKNIVALGGVTDKNIPIAKDLGFMGVAALGYIWEGNNPVVNFLKIKQAVL